VLSADDLSELTAAACRGIAGEDRLQT
jgi:hypothetical protein